MGKNCIYFLTHYILFHFFLIIDPFYHESLLKFSTQALSLSTDLLNISTVNSVFPVSQKGEDAIVRVLLLIFIAHRFQMAAQSKVLVLSVNGWNSRLGVVPAPTGCVHSDLCLHGDNETGVECAHPRSPQSSKTGKVPILPRFTVTFFSTNCTPGVVRV